MGSLWRRTMPHSSAPPAPTTTQSLASNKCKLSQHRVGGEAASWHEMKSWSCFRRGGEGRNAAPRTFPLARVTVGACREHTPMLPVTLPAFISIAKPFNAVVVYTQQRRCKKSYIHSKSVTYQAIFVNSQMLWLWKCLKKSVSKKILQQVDPSGAKWSQVKSYVKC